MTVSSRDIEAALERRIARRRLLLWRILATLGLSLAVLAGLYAYDPALLRAQDHVARVRLEGVMLGDGGVEELIEQVRTTPHAKALVLYIDSPGGGTFQGESIYVHLRRLAEEKPVVAVIGPLGASAAYMAAVAADHVLARENSITGSIGVIFETAEASDLMKKIGVNAEAITSGPLKDTPSVTKPLSEQGRQYLQGLVNETHAWFVSLVAERRELDRDEVVKLADGRIYLGAQAAELGLIDAIGGEIEAMRWLAENRNIPESLPIQDYTESPYGEGIWGATESLLRTLTRAIHAAIPARDGLVSIWRVDAVR